ncbi:MAG: hypothetical protein KGS61_17955, partial [Verrucomicrobia bacterium]|nr:hypothetical protein [Verrucomicrobiota bacterium]
MQPRRFVHPTPGAASAPSRPAHRLRQFPPPTPLYLLVIFAHALATARGADLSRATLVTPPNLSAPERKAITMLVEEVEKRSRVRWPIAQAWPAAPTPVVAVGPASALRDFGGKFAADLAADPGVAGAEGFRIRQRRDGDASAVFVIGNDARGVLFGIGRLLRELRMRPGAISLPDELSIATAPQYPLRGHQLGY